MKNFFKGIVAVWVLSLLSSMVFAQTSIDTMNFPKLTQWVTDFSNSLSASQLGELNAIAKNYETQSSNQIVAVVFPNRNGNELIDIGMKIFTDNGIGRKDVNNGLLLLISSEEKKIRIIVWYGLEGVYPDLMASQVIENDIRPLVNAGDIAGAIKIFYERSQQIIGGEIPVGYTTSSSFWQDDSMYIAMFLGFVLWLWIKRLWKLRSTKHTKKSFLIWFAFFFLGALFVGIYFIGTVLLFVSLGILFGLVWVIPWFGRGLGWWGFGGWFWWWGGFSWWWGVSWGGGAGD